MYILKPVVKPLTGRSFTVVNTAVLQARKWTRLGLILLILVAVSLHFLIEERILTEHVAFMPHYPAFIAVSESDAQMSTGHSLDTAVWWNTPKAKGYLASLEVFHHLHCLVRNSLLRIPRWC